MPILFKSFYFILMISLLFAFKYSKVKLMNKVIFSAKATTESQSTNLIDSFPVIHLFKGKARIFQDGNPLVYGGAIEKVTGDPLIGDEVIVKDYMNNPIGRGIYNPLSTYRVRLFARNYEDIYNFTLEDILTYRIKLAKGLRENLNLLTDKVNSVYRLVNGEGDRLGGLIIDVLGDYVIIQSSAYWVEKYKEKIIRITENIMGQSYQIIWRQSEVRLKQDGFTDITTQTTVSIHDKHIVYENNIKYYIYPEEGQKTGFFCDQRENRNLIKQLSNNKTVLDTYCYTGGFALNALLGGAKEVLAIDSSQNAIDIATENYKLNNLPIDSNIKFIKADAIEYMKLLVSKGYQYDIVICDPPKLAPTRSSLDKAKNKYITINKLGMSLVKKGGLMLTCTCSAAVTQSNEFNRILFDSSKLVRRDITILSTSHAASDHPTHISYPESNYLTAVLLRVI